MQMQDYVMKYDCLASEDPLFEIPFRNKFILSKIGRCKKVLDVGCLGGKLSRLIADQNNEVWGVELNPAAATEARKLGIKVKVVDIGEGLPFESGTFDVVNAAQVVEQLYDTKFFFQEVSRVLKPGGFLLFTTPNLNSLENRVRILTGGYLAMTGAYPEDHFGGNVRVFNLTKIKELCQQTGFKFKSARGLAKLGSWGVLLDQAVGMAGRLMPNISKLLVVTVQKIS